MGLIKRNEFWFDHHCVYVEPNDEQKQIAKNETRKSKTALMQLLAMTILISSMNNNTHKER